MIVRGRDQRFYVVFFTGESWEVYKMGDPVFPFDVNEQCASCSTAVSTLSGCAVCAPYKSHRT